MTLTAIDWLIMAVYLVFVLGIGFWLRRSIRTSTDFFLSGRSIPAWVAGLAFARQGAGDTDRLFQAIHLIEAIFGRFANDAVGARIQVSLLTHGQCTPTNG